MTDFKPKAAIFDMDGLMLDTERPVIPVWVRAGKNIGWDISEETAIHTIGIDGEDTQKVCMDELGAEFPYDKFSTELHRLYFEEFENGIVHKTGLLDLLNHLRAIGIPMAVGTSSRRKPALWKLEKAGISAYFSLVVGGDDVRYSKPAPDIFIEAARKLGFPPGECVGFEDSPAGLKALSDAGIPSVFIKDIIEPPDEILDTVWKRLNNLAEAIPLFT